jgi:hypothetical protein
LFCSRLLRYVQRGALDVGAEAARAEDRAPDAYKTKPPNDLVEKNDVAFLTAVVYKF